MSGGYLRHPLVLQTCLQSQESKDYAVRGEPCALLLTTRSFATPQAFLGLSDTPTCPPRLFSPFNLSLLDPSIRVFSSYG